MSLRFTPEQAVKLGLISQDEAEQMLKKQRAARKSTRSATKAKIDPQQILFAALCKRLPGLPESEREGLVPGRKFRADIFIPPNIVVEMDGFAYHSSKSAFQKDRERENLFAVHGYRIFRTYTKEVLGEESLPRLVELIAMAVEQSRGHSDPRQSTKS